MNLVTVNDLFLDFHFHLYAFQINPIPDIWKYIVDHLLNPYSFNFLSIVAFITI